MAVRVSQTYVGVIGKAPGICRVGQVYLSILLKRNTFNLEIEQELELADEFEGVIDGAPLELELNQSLTLTDEFISDTYFTELQQTLNFAQAFDFGGIYFVSFENELELTDEYSEIPLIEIPVEFGDVIRYYNPLTSSFEGLDDLFTISLDNVTRELTQTLSFAQVFGRVIELEWENELTLTDAFVQPIAQILEFEETWTATDCFELNQTLDLEQTFHVLNDLDHTFNQTLDFNEAWKIIATIDTCNYQLPDPPTFGQGTLTLEIDATTLVLRNPQFNDVRQLGFTRIQRETRGGTLVVFADPIWPKATILRYTISALPDKQAILDFLQLSLGRVVTLTDHYGREYEGLILNSNTAVTAALPGCGYEFQLEFEIL